MSTNAERLRAAFESRDLEQLIALLDERVVWRGLPPWDYRRNGDLGIVADDLPEPDDHAGADEEGGHDHERVPLCTSREEVLALLEGFLAAGGTGQPAIVAEAGDSLVVDPHVEPALSFPLHHALTFRGGRIVLIQDYPDRATALADLSRR
jgi:ketosteroid isomerase-like protein